VDSPRRRIRAAVLGAAWLLLMLAGAPLEANAQANDPGNTVLAYSQALNAHDVAGALALFGEYGSATDVRGHVYQGRAALTQFLLSNGFDGGHVTTSKLQVVGNRALWTYSCSCAQDPIFVRVVMSQDGINVFAMSADAPPAAAQAKPADSRLVAWLAAIATFTCVLAAVLLGTRRRHPPPAPLRPAQGRLIAGLDL
jgi:hypothetical protein